MTRQLRSRPRLVGHVVALGAAVALVAAACGGDDADLTDAVGDPAATAEQAPPEPEPEPTATPVTEAEPEPTPSAQPTPTPDPTPTPEPPPALELAVSGLPVLDGEFAAYEAWLVVDGAPVSAGTFADPAAARLDVTGDMVAPSAVIVTVETDDDPAPSDTKVLAGGFVDGVAQLTVTDPAAIGVDFASATGQYILATPTDGTGSPENERSGVWWTFIPRAQSLVLPTLPAGWIYEGWQVIDGVPVTTGTFVSQFGEPDHAAPYSGPTPGPPFPGEDFVANAPDGLTFPVDLRGSEVVISVEPFPDTGPEPFPLIPLRGTVPADAVDHTHYAVDNVADTLPAGTARIG